MSKGAGLHPKANSQDQIQDIALGEGPVVDAVWFTRLLQGEDAAAYDELLGRVYAA